jgi:hypothetical protein
VSEEKKYLLILSALIQAGIHTGEISKEIQIECNPNELNREIRMEKDMWRSDLKAINRKNDPTDEAEVCISVNVKQVLPL